MANGQQTESVVLAPKDVVPSTVAEDLAGALEKMRHVGNAKPGSSTAGDASGSSANDGTKRGANDTGKGDSTYKDIDPSMLTSLLATITEQDKPESLPTGDTFIREHNRDIIIMPKNEGSLTINRDGSFDLQLNKNSKEKAEIEQNNGVTTITFEPSGDRISFDKDGPISISRGGQGVSWLRFAPQEFKRILPGDRTPPLGDPGDRAPVPGDPGSRAPVPAPGDRAPVPVPGNRAPVPGAPPNSDAPPPLQPGNPLPPGTNGGVGDILKKVPIDGDQSPQQQK